MTWLALFSHLCLFNKILCCSKMLCSILRLFIKFHLCARWGPRRSSLKLLHLELICLLLHISFQLLMLPTVDCNFSLKSSWFAWALQYYSCGAIFLCCTLDLTGLMQNLPSKMWSVCKSAPLYALTPSKKDFKFLLYAHNVFISSIILTNLTELLFFFCWVWTLLAVSA